MEKLILLTNHFPFGHGEAFLEGEFEYLKKEFQYITIVALTNEKNQTRSITEGCELINYDTRSTKGQKLISPFLVFRELITVLFFLGNEIRIIKSLKIKLKIKLLQESIHDLIKGIQLYYFLKRNIGFNNPNQIFYAYWLSSQATALMIAKRKNPNIVAIARGHSVDIYPFRHKLNYIPFEKQKVDILDRTFFVSKHGVNFYKDFFRELPSNISLAPLGTSIIKSNTKQKSYDNKILLSISNIVAIKRINLIIEALSLINDMSITWLHIGDGELRNEITDYANDKLKDKRNIGYHFLGQMSNSEVHKFLASTKIDLFINVSEIEAIPVSIREAMSYGIPCLATNVGGTNEIVNEKTGFLLDANPKPEKIMKEIEKYFLLPQNSVENFKINAYKYWKQNFSSEVVYPKFIKEIGELIKPSK